MPSPRPLTGLRALVTGASSGIGAAVSSLLAQGGARVVGTGRDAAALAAGAVAVGNPFEATVARDLLEVGAPAAVVAAAVSALGGLDLVISNAGAGWTGPYASMPLSALDTLVDINLRVPMHLAQAAAPHLRDSVAGGQLVLVGSIAGLIGVPDEVAYATAKAGLRGLADSLRAEWSAEHVTVTLVSPGPVDTPFFSRRNLPYSRAWPRPLPVGTVAQAIVQAVATRREEAVVPAWLALPARLNGAWPALFRRLAGLQQHFG